MARNGSGTYSVPNTFTPNTVMSATAVNANFTDAGNELTNSMARDGQSTMTGQFKIIDGSVDAPGIAFGSDTNTGFRRASADEMRWVGGGADRMYIDSAGKAYLLGDLDVAGDLNVQGAISGDGLTGIAAIEAVDGIGLLKRTGDDTWDVDEVVCSFGFTCDHSGEVLDTGVVADITIPFDCTLTGWTLMADQSGSIKIDVWKDVFANFPPTNTDSITNAHEPTISSAAKAEDTDISDWTSVDVSAGDCIRFNIDSVTTITRITLLLHAKRYNNAS